MSNIFGKIAIFATGAAVGSAVTWKLIKDKYEQMAREDIQSVRDYYAKKHECDEEEARDVEEEDEDPVAVDEEDIAEYHELLETLNYSGKNDISEKGEPEEDDDPKVICPDEFGELDDYEIRSLTYYPDGVLTDEDNNIIEDVDSLVGEDSLSHFGEYEEDSVFVRNAELETDFEILMDPRNYADLYPSQADD